MLRTRLADRDRRRVRVPLHFIASVMQRQLVAAGAAIRGEGLNGSHTAEGYHVRPELALFAASLGNDAVGAALAVVAAGVDAPRHPVPLDLDRLAEFSELGEQVLRLLRPEGGRTVLGRFIRCCVVTADLGRSCHGVIGRAGRSSGVRSGFTPGNPTAVAARVGRGRRFVRSGHYSK